MLDYLCSSNCAYKRLACQFPPPDDIFRYEEPGSKADLPGMQAVWSIGSRQVIWQPGDSGVDPFDSLPIKMPLRSQELFSYCTSPLHVIFSPVPYMRWNVEDVSG